jgi:hypothetical protein
MIDVWSDSTERPAMGESPVGSIRRLTWLGAMLGVLAVAGAQARPIPLVKSSSRAPGTVNAGFLVVPNGAYPETSSPCWDPVVPHASLEMIFGGILQPAPVVIGVYWPGLQPPDPMVHTLFKDFATDLFNGPLWNAVMPQYMGSVHATVLPNIDLPSLLTVSLGNTVHSRDIAPELRAQIAAGVLPRDSMNYVYVLHFPPGVNIVDETYNYIDNFGNPQLHVNIGSSCVQYCAYHDMDLRITPTSSPDFIAFVVMPDFTQNASCLTGCGTGTPFDVYTKVLSHELLETVSDPYGVGWFNTCPAGSEEIADPCTEYQFYVPRRVSTPGTPRCPQQWALSSVFSNAAFHPSTHNGCVVTDAVPQQNCTAGVVPERPLATTLELSAPAPNPTMAGTRLRYTTPFASFVRLSVLDVSGRQVAVLEQQVEGPGTHDATWDGSDASGTRVPAGIYFARLDAAGQTVARRVVIDR